MLSLGFTETEFSRSYFHRGDRWAILLLTNYVLKWTWATSRDLSSLWQNGDVRNSVLLWSLTWCVVPTRDMSPHPACFLRRAEWVSGCCKNWRRCLRPSRREGALFYSSPPISPLVVKAVDWWKKQGHLVHPPLLSSQLKGYLLKEAFLRVLIASSDNWSKKGALHLGVQRRRLIGWISSAHPDPGNTSP